MYNSIIERLEQDSSILKMKIFGGEGYERIILAPYTLKVMFKNNEYGIFGRGALRMSQSVESFGDSDTSKPSITVGNMSECANDSNIMLGGEHQHNHIVNNSLAVYPDTVNALNKLGIDFKKSISKGPIKIGGNVTISRGATILSGVTIGDGAVIGAGAIVTKDVPPFAIVSGSPAQIIKYRFDESIIKDLLRIRWWDFKQEFFTKHFQDIQNIGKDESLKKFDNVDPSAYINDKDHIVMSFRREGARHFMGFLGAEINGQFIEQKDTPLEYQFFTNQISAKAGDKIYLIKDIFKYSGIASKAA